MNNFLVNTMDNILQKPEIKWDYIIYAGRYTSDECWVFCTAKEFDTLLAEWKTDHPPQIVNYAKNPFNIEGQNLEEVLNK